MLKPVKVIREGGVLYSLSGDDGLVYRSVEIVLGNQRHWVKDDGDRKMADIWGYDNHAYGVGRTSRSTSCSRRVTRLTRSTFGPNEGNYFCRPYHFMKDTMEWVWRFRATTIATTMASWVRRTSTRPNMDKATDLYRLRYVRGNAT